MSMPHHTATPRRVRTAAASILAATVLGVSTTVARGDAPPAPAVAAADSIAQSDPVIQWNNVLIGILSTPGAQPAAVHPTRSLAILHAAIYDAVDSIQHKYTPYLVSIRAPRRADATAAAAAAGYTTLTSLYPNQQETIDSAFASMLAHVPNGYHKYEGVRTGEAVAAALLALRSDDGSAAQQPVFTPDSQPGRYQLTPPAFAQPVDTQWPSVRPFVLRTADQFRPGRRRP
jgi:hypothetical protein